MTIPAVESHFKRLQRFESEYSHAQFTQYESSRTGMRVVVVDREGPKVNGYFSLATEIHDDSGAPHTLEHLCFMGSKNFQYKGILDKLAARAYSNTNAWTATDHTAYTLETAGWEGFAQILPVYLDHVIVPTLTDAGCYTEVWHIDGEGNDAGVVYSEMQGVQNDQIELMDLQSRRLLYPEGIGFRYCTDGLMERLRVLQPEKIRSFHKEMYQPRNLCLVLIGSVEHESLLHVLDVFEDTILCDVPKMVTPFKRPWVESGQMPPLKQSESEVVEFPDEDESMGEIMIHFFGPPYSDRLLTRALDILIQYLSGSSASVLSNTLVEKEQLASAAYFDVSYRTESLVTYNINSVPTENLQTVEARFFEILRDVVEKPIDMKYMRDCVLLDRRQRMFSAETWPQESFAEPVIRNFLFGDREFEMLEKDFGSLSIYETLFSWTDTQWQQWIKTWLVDAAHITVFGKPSAEMSKKLKYGEKARIKARRNELGEEGLSKLKKQLIQAQAENDKPIPADVLEQFPVPSTDSIHFITTVSAVAGKARKADAVGNPTQELIDQDKSNLDLQLHFEHIQSRFAYIRMLVSTDKVPINLRPLLSIFTELFFASPMVQNGRRRDFEQIIMDLDRDSVQYELSSGQELGNAEALAVSMVVEVESYERGIEWLRDLMFASIFDLERIRTATAKLLSEIPKQKRDGSDMLSAIHEHIVSLPASINHADSTLVQGRYLKYVQKMLSEDPDVVVTQLKDISSALWQLCNFKVLVTADTTKLQKPVSAWKTLVDSCKSDQTLDSYGTRLSRLSDQGKSPADKAYIVSLPTIDSSFAIVTAKGPSSHNDPLVPALMVAASYLNAVEGPLWVAVRGKGLAYGVSIRQRRDAGQISLAISSSPDTYKAYCACQAAVEDLALGKVPFDPLTLEGAVSTIVLDMAEAEATMASAAQASFVRQVVRGQSKDWVKILLGKIREVTISEVKAAMKSTILPLFNPEQSILVVTCAPIMQTGLKTGFESRGLKPEIKNLADFRDDYGYDMDSEEEDDDDDASDDEGEYTEGSDDDDERNDEDEKMEDGADKGDEI